MEVDCLKCVNSACCKLVIEVDKKEYDSLCDKGIKDSFVTHVDKFIEQHPKFESKRKFLAQNYTGNFAEMKKDSNGLCVNLDKKTMLCYIYENRPKVCRDYKTERCSKIRKICTS